MTVDPVSGQRVSMLLLGSPVRDFRVLKTVRSLQAGGYQVTLWCIAPPIAPGDIPELAGASVRTCRAVRPLSWLLGRIRRMTPGPAHPSALDNNAAGEAAPGLMREARAILGTLWINLALWWAARREPAAYIHAHDLDTLFAGVLLRGSLRARLIYDAHELYPEMLEGRSPLYMGVWRLIEHRLIRAASAVITVNDALAHELQRRHALPCRPTIVMNCPPLAAAPARSPRPDAEIGVIYQGALHAERGLKDLVRAAAQLPDNVVLYLRGPGPLRQALEDLARRHGVAERVRILAPVTPDALVSSLGQFTLGLVTYAPTTLNNFFSTPNKLFEYMMAGLPVVAGDLPEIRRIILTHGAGQVYPASDVSAMIAAIRALIADESRLEACGRSARKAAIDHFNWERQAHRLLGVYASMEGTAPRP